MRANALSAIHSISIGNRPSADFFNTIEYQQTLARIAEPKQSDPDSQELQHLRASLADYERTLGKDYAES